MNTHSVLTIEPVVTDLAERPLVEAKPGQCTARTSSTGARCRRQAITGAAVCYVHGGAAPQVKRAAARRLAEAKAAESLADVEVFPIGNPLEALTAVAEEARAFMQFAAAKVAELDTLDDVAGATRVEYLRPMVALYERATDRAARLLADWVRLGFDERMVTLHEHQAELVEQFLFAVVADLQLTDTQTAALPDAAVRHLPILTGTEVTP